MHSNCAPSGWTSGDVVSPAPIARHCLTRSFDLLRARTRVATDADVVAEAFSSGGEPARRSVWVRAIPEYRSGERHRGGSRGALSIALASLVALASGGAFASLGAQDAPAGAAAQAPREPLAAVGAGARQPDSLALTLAEARRRALQYNPAFRAERESRGIAAGGLRQARLLRFNPDVSLLVPGPGIAGSRNAAEFTLLQEVEVAGQRGLRTSAARFGVTRADAMATDAARLTLAEASLAFFRAVAAARRLEVTREVLQLTERLLDAVRTQSREGEISVLEGNLAEIEFGRARGRVLAAQREAVVSSLELARVTGTAPGVPLKLVAPALDSAMQGGPPPTDVRSAAQMAALDADSLSAIALARRPDLSAAVATVRQADVLVDVSRREALPNLRVGVLAERTPGEMRTRLGPAIGMTLPVFNRASGLVAQRQAESRQAQYLRDATQLRVRTEVAAATRALQAASAELAVFESSVRQPARANSALLEAAFRAGKIALPTLLLLRNQLLDAELGYWQAWLARQESLTQLESATGALVHGPDALVSTTGSLP